MLPHEPEQCPSDNTIAEYVDGLLHFGAHTKVTRPIVHCTNCFDAVKAGFEAKRTAQRRSFSALDIARGWILERSSANYGRRSSTVFRSRAPLKK